MASFTLSTNSFATLNFAAATDKWTINPGVVLAVATGTAVQSFFASNKLVNHGDIFSGNGIATVFSGAGFRLTNAADGSITGFNAGVFVNAANAIITNAGEIKGLNNLGVVLSAGAGNTTLNNTGEIVGGNIGVADISAVGGSDIYNAGMMRGSNYGVAVIVGPLLRTSIDNSAQGTIKGGLAGIVETSGSTTVDNDGEILAGTLGGLVFVGPTGNDKVFNHGKIVGKSLLGNGNDLFNGTDGVQGKVFGEAGNDTLIGGAKADRLNGGLGRDIERGNLGADRFDFDSVLDSAVGALRDIVKDFSHAQHDRIDVTTIDANTLVGLDQDFVFRGTQAFNNVGQVRYQKIDLAGTANDKTIVSGTVDADLAPEFQIELKGLFNLVVGDFVL